MQTELVWI